MLLLFSNTFVAILGMLTSEAVKFSQYEDCPRAKQIQGLLIRTLASFILFHFCNYFLHVLAVPKVK